MYQRRGTYEIYFHLDQTTKLKETLSILSQKLENSDEKVFDEPGLPTEFDAEKSDEKEFNGGFFFDKLNSTRVLVQRYINILEIPSKTYVKKKIGYKLCESHSDCIYYIYDYFQLFGKKMMKLIPFFRSPSSSMNIFKSQMVVNDFFIHLQLRKKIDHMNFDLELKTERIWKMYITNPYREYCRIYYGILEFRSICENLFGRSSRMLPY